MTMDTVRPPSSRNGVFFRGHHAAPFGISPYQCRGLNASSVGGITGSTAQSSSVTMKQLKQMMITMILVTASFYAGTLSGMHASKHHFASLKIYRSAEVECPVECLSSSNIIAEENSRIEETVQRQVSEELARREENDHPSKRQEPNVSNPLNTRFGPNMSKYVVGMAKTTKKEFASIFDYGTPLDDKIDLGASEVIILYSHKDALPFSLDPDRKNATVYDDGNGIPMLGTRDATENCDSLNVVVTRAMGRLHQCVAIMEGYESYHIQRWMRISEESNLQGAKFNKNLPLRHVSRGMQSNGEDNFHPPPTSVIEEHWKLLRQYLTTVDEVLEQLRPIAKHVAKDNTIVVMVCNMGQSTLLVNFVCSARARDFDVSSVLVFATDEDTLHVAQGLGLAAFYDEKVRVTLHICIRLTSTSCSRCL